MSALVPTSGLAVTIADDRFLDGRSGVVIAQAQSSDCLWVVSLAAGGIVTLPAHKLAAA